MKLKRIVIIPFLLLTITKVNAYTVNVNSSIPVETRIMPGLEAIEVTLGEILAVENLTLKVSQEIGTAIVQASDKNTAIIEQTAKMNKDFLIYQKKVERLEAARVSYSVPTTICSESTSTVANKVKNTSKILASGLISGRNIIDSDIKKLYTSPKQSIATDSYRAANVHSKYCTEAEYSSYGDTNLCLAVSNYPAGDSELRSVLYGAGHYDKNPDLTFTPEQIDAAMAYAKNTAGLTAGRDLKKGEIETTSGRLYHGYLTQYKSIQNAGITPQLEIISSSIPNDSTIEALAESLQTKSAIEYFNNNASDYAKQNKIMSEREYETFEVGRRHSNIEYLADLQEMQGDNLLREQIRVTNLNNFLLLKQKESIQQTNILMGQLLVLSAEENFRPKLEALLRKVSSGVTFND